MKLSLDGLKNTAAWELAGVRLPSYDVARLQAETHADPRWVHFGIGNIFRIFIGAIADRLICEKLLDRGITCVETFDYDVVDKIYRPFDNLALAVTLRGDGSRDMAVLGSLGEAVKAQSSDPASRARLAEIFTHPKLQLVSFTITEKGYALRSPDGEYLPYVSRDIKAGPDEASGTMGIVAALLYRRWQSGGEPLALLSLDNVSHNGSKLRQSVLEMARAWVEGGFMDREFLAYAEDESQVSFPWSMIDKITPRPGEAVAQALSAAGIEDMQITVTSRHTYIAPFVNAEAPQYLVIEDSFPNGRPPLEQAGVYMTDRETVNRSERMKVTVCLNPIHTALCTYDCLLGYRMFADGMRDPDLLALARMLGYKEGLPVVDDPKILSPKKFLDEVLNERFPNVYMGDTSARIATDISQMVGIRFGHTINEYVRREGSAERLVAVPLAIAGWIRYLLALDDQGEKYELSSDPMLGWLSEKLKGVKFGDPAEVRDQLRPILSNTAIFGVDLYEAGLGAKIEQMVRELIAGPGAVRKVLHRYLQDAGAI